MQRQLAESESREATLQATIEETCDTLALTDLDYERIAAAMQQQRSRNQSTDRSLNTGLSKSTWSPKQLDLPLLSNSKNLTYTS